MIFTKTRLKGAFVIEIQKLEDERGFFARIFCQNEFREHGLNANLAQCNISYNRKKGTLRGIHFQASPYQEAKLVHCIQGSIWDVIIDLRPASPTYKEHFGLPLTSANHQMLYVPEGFGHGFITLEDESTVYYQMSEFHAAGYARGFRWNDPDFNIEWPLEVNVISDRDANYPDFSPDLLL